MKKRFLLLLFLLVHALHAQKYPVQITPVLVPPYLATLSGYSTTMNEKFGLQLYVSDLTLTRRQVYLKLYIEGNGIQATSAPFVEGIAPLFLSGGDVVQLTQADLAPYFKIQNLQGISPAQYGKPLPQGMYKFCAELYDFYSREKIAQKSCAMGYFMVNSPPQLNLPANHESIDSKSFQNIFFSWTPRHISAGNVEYEFTMVELLDPMMPAGSGFFVSRPLYQTTTPTPSLLYGPAEPLLLPGKKYAWRVQARTTSGFGDGASFENDGYSEIFDFTFKGDCDKPQFVLAEPKTNTQVKVSWQQNPNHTHYLMQTRKKGTTEWFEGEGDQPTANINDLEAGQSYEFRVGAYCMDNVLSFSSIIDFTMPAKKSKDFQCGLEPNIDLSNQTRYSGTLNKGQEFMAGDFAVHVLEATGTDTFSGKAWIKVPYLGLMRIAVEFKDIQLNTNLQLIAGEVKTTYDPEWKNVLDINEAIGDVKEVADAIGDLVDGISELFKKWDDLEEQKKQNKISETDYNKQWKEVYDELEEANNQYKGIVNSPDIPEELKQKVKDLDPVLVDLASNNYTTKGNQTKANKEKIEAAYKEVESALNNLALDGKLTPPSVTNTYNDKPIEKPKVSLTLLNEIETACTVNDGSSIKIGMTKAQNKAGEFYSYCKANTGTFYIYKGNKYWYIRGEWYITTTCNQETCIKVCTKINADGTGTYERIAENLDGSISLPNTKEGLVIFANGFKFGKEIGDELVTFASANSIDKGILLINKFYSGDMNRNSSVVLKDESNYWEQVDDLFMLRIGYTKKMYIDGSYDVLTARTQSGFENRRNGGIEVAQNILSKLKEWNYSKTIPIDVVCHSMGFAYALGTIETLQNAGYKIGWVYALAPENPSEGKTPQNLEGIWQYGSNEKQDPVMNQDWIAPQAPIRGIRDNQRSYIPDTEPKGPYDCHAIKNYEWVFDRKKNDPLGGYVKSRR